MENRLCLNKVPDYSCELFTVKLCIRSDSRQKRIPATTPDIRLNSYGCPFMEVLKDKEKSNELWIYLKNKEDKDKLIEWINNIDGLTLLYGGNKASDRAGSPSIQKGRLEKIIKEEFYKLK